MANVDKNIVILTDLSQRGFETLTVAGKRQIVPRVSTTPNNRLSLQEGGLEVVDPPLRKFQLTPTANVRLTDNQEFRHILYLSGNFGVLHLDFTLVGGSGNVPLFNVPQDCPLPLHIIEQMIAGNKPCWWVPGERTIYCDASATRNQRIIVHASGIFA